MSKAVMWENFYQLCGFFVPCPGPEFVVRDSGDGLLVPVESLLVVAFPYTTLQGRTPLIVRRLRVMGRGRVAVGFKVVENMVIHFSTDGVKFFVANGDLAVCGFVNPKFKFFPIRNRKGFFERRITLSRLSIRCFVRFGRRCFAFSK